MYTENYFRDRIEDNSKYTAQAWTFAKQIFHLTRPHLLIGNMTTGNANQKIFDNQKRYFPRNLFILKKTWKK